MKREEKIKFHILRQEIPHEIRNVLSIVYVMKGEMDVEINKCLYTVSAGGFFVIPPFSVCRIAYASAQNVGIEIWIRYDYLEQCGWPGYLRQHYVVCSDASDNKSDEIRQLFADSYKQSTYGDEMNVTLSVQRLLKAVQDNSSITEERSKQLDTQMKHIDQVLRYIYKHWKEDINTHNLAQEESLSISYLSHMFKRWMNVPIVKYISEVRLYHAYKELDNANASITEIALDHGFKNTNMFISSFRERYGKTPGKYRKIYADAPSKGEMYHDFSSLLKYASEDAQMVPQKEEISVRLAWDKSDGELFGTTWKNLVNVAFARDVLFEPIQKQLKLIQEKIGFRYIHFHGLFDGEMYVYDEDEQGNPKYSFFYIDWVFDFLQSIHLKPYMDFSYMPYKLAKDKSHTWMKGGWFSIYNDKKKWEELVKATLRHFIDRYGIDEVRSWYFISLILTPNEAENIGMMPERNFYEFYETTWNAVKSVDRNLRFGGPGCFTGEIWSGKMLERFMKFSHKNRCPADFYSFQCYPHERLEYNEEFGFYSERQDAEPIIPSTDAHYTNRFLTDWRKLAKEYGEDGKEVWFEQWNSTIWQRDPANDSAFKAAWVVKDICENHHLAEGFGYWMMLDFNEEHDLQVTSVFHGGMGMFTLSGIPKSSWMALELLNKLNGRVVARGENWMAVRNDKELQIIVYHYCHYNNFLLRRDEIFVAREDTYQLFVQKEKMNIFVEVDDCREKSYSVRQVSLNREFGSSFDQWLNMGMPSYLDKIRDQELRDSAHPLVKSRILYPEDGKLKFKTDMMPHEVQLWTIENLE
ncbi:MAG: GH39 family glycosyl hydrolase [Lachnospiraceae bacterium]